jgi:D-methionine transport system ATP-binding protein
VIKIENLTKTFSGKNSELTAVNDVSLEIGQGQIYGIVGYSGAGKSTLVRCINFLETPDSGKISFDDFGTIEFLNGKSYISSDDKVQNVPFKEKDKRNIRRDIGMIFQHFNLMDRSTVFENIAYPLKHTGRSRSEIQARVLELLELVDLTDKVNSYPSELSGGQKQRVAIARALANNPRILLSDEATSALDPDATESILRLLKELNKKLNLTVVLITHEMAVVKSICDRVAVMENGKVVEEGNVYEVFANPKQKITKKFVDSSSVMGKIEHLIEDSSPELAKNGTLIKCVYGKDSVGDAIISEVSRKYGINMNIILGNVELLQGSPLGGLVVLVTGPKDKCKAAIEYMRSCNVKVEVLANE